MNGRVVTIDGFVKRSQDDPPLTIGEYYPGESDEGIQIWRKDRERFIRFEINQQWTRFGEQTTLQALSLREMMDAANNWWGTFCVYTQMIEEVISDFLLELRERGTPIDLPQSWEYSVEAGIEVETGEIAHIGLYVYEDLPAPFNGKRHKIPKAVDENAILEALRNPIQEAFG